MLLRHLTELTTAFCRSEYIYYLLSQALHLRYIFDFPGKSLRMFVALMCAIHVWINGSVYLFIMGNDEVDSFVYNGVLGICVSLLFH